MPAQQNNPYSKPFMDDYGPWSKRLPPSSSQPISNEAAISNSPRQPAGGNHYPDTPHQWRETDPTPPPTPSSPPEYDSLPSTPPPTYKETSGTASAAQPSFAPPPPPPPLPSPPPVDSR